MQVRGRYLILGWTAVFLAAVGAIVLRDLSGFAVRQRLDRVTLPRIKALESMRNDRAGDIATLESHDVLAPKVQALGLRVASDAELYALHLTSHP